MAGAFDKDIVDVPTTPTTSVDSGIDVAQKKADLRAQQESYLQGRNETRVTLYGQKTTLEELGRRANEITDPAERAWFIETQKDALNSVELGLKLQAIIDANDNSFAGAGKDALKLLKGDQFLKATGATGQSNTGKYYVDGVEVDVNQYATASTKAKYDKAYQSAYDRIKAENPGYTEENIIRDAKDEAARLSGTGGPSGFDRSSFGGGSSGGGGATFAGFDANNQPIYNYGTQSQAMTSQEYASRQDVMDTMRAKFKDYGLEALIPTIEKLAMEGATESTIFLSLRESDAYKARFAANEDRKKAGLAVLDPKTYLAVEDSYRQTLRAYGLKQFDNDNYVRQFIANDMSPTELANRVSTAVERVQNADPTILRTLQDYYGIGSADLVSYTLDPDNQLQKIQRQVSAAEIGAAARKQGLESGSAVAESLAAQGITQAQAQKGYSSIAEVLPTAEKLSDIYSTQAERYDQTAAEQETFNSLASAQRKRQKLAGLEIGTFSGQSGMSKASLASKSAGQF